MRVSIIVLTMGDRPEALDKSLRSALAQTYDDFEVFCLGNGWQPENLPEGVRSLATEENLGSVAGRNFAVTQCECEFFLFLDDDGWLPDPEFLNRAIAIYTKDPKLGMLQARIADADGTTLRRWVPRARIGDPAKSGPAFSCNEGVTMFRRRAWDELGGFPENFFHGHEGIDVVWRLRDHGWEAWYQADLVIHHPALPAARHAYYQRLNARNRVWVARRNLPAPLIPIYVGVWTAISLIRNRGDSEAIRTWVAGWREGWRTDPGPRTPMKWKTVAHLARLGQPPII